MTIGRQRRAFGVYSRQEELEAALEELRESGFPMEKVSVVAKEQSSKNPRQGVNLSVRTGREVRTGAAVGSVTGSVLGVLAGLLAGLSTIAVPGLGAVVIAETVGATIATVFAGGGIGALSGGIIGALVGLGIPKERAKVYSDRLMRGDYLLVVEGKSDEVMRAQMILLGSRGIEEWTVVDAHSEQVLEVEQRKEPKAEQT